MLKFDNTINLLLDGEAILTLLFTSIYLVIILYYFRHNVNISRYMDVFSFNKFTLFPLLIIGFLSLWMTFRFTGLHLLKFLTTNTYLPDQILNLLAWLLTTNLCFTLFNAFTLPDEGNNKNKLEGLVNVSIQAIIIGIITFLPRNSTLQLDLIGGATNYLMILIGLIISLSLLIILRERIH